jgi:hypothetical protein
VLPPRACNECLLLRLRLLLLLRLLLQLHPLLR